MQQVAFCLHLTVTTTATETRSLFPSIVKNLYTQLPFTPISGMGVGKVLYRILLVLENLHCFFPSILVFSTAHQLLDFHMNKRV